GSNSGGAVLRQFFDDDQMKRLTFRLHPEHPTGLGYYPLPGPGERFPFNAPDMAPRLTPRPDDPAVFFQGLLEGIAAVEAAAYRRLAALGAPYPASVRSVGGGARNPCWTRIRRRLLGVPVDRPNHGEAAYGTALLALRGA
ncbi:MAG TPA: FGGY-family carbohydrate kinase, partial [Gammaproteobacteria bacterium]|nr:FGGY-family carbohydrate kinase [Gammaproteobacteria bacterium]